MKSVKLALAAVLSCVCSSGAMAQTSSYTFDVDGTSGTFDLDFSSDTLSAFDWTAPDGYNFNLSNTSAIVGYQNTIIGGDYLGPGSLGSHVDDFVFLFSPSQSGSNPPKFFIYADPAGDTFFASATVTRLVSAAPEPATWAMMILGFGIAGAAIRRQRRADVAGRVAFA